MADFLIDKPGASFSVIIYFGVRSPVSALSVNLSQVCIIQIEIVASSRH